jgi:5-methylcytosine-specific restriction endonuclease McrA
MNLANIEHHSEKLKQYLAEEIFASLPGDLRSLSYAVIQENTTLGEKYDLPLDPRLLEAITEHLPPTISDSLVSYGLIKPDLTDLDRLLEPTITEYISTVSGAPPEYNPALTASRPDGCEICGREHLPLTYHHLIPRQMHEKALKRGWHKEWELQKVAWLCRACHSYIHRILTNEELAKEWYEVEKLMDRDDVQKWANWVGKIRWKAR